MDKLNRLSRHIVLPLGLFLLTVIPAVHADVATLPPPGATRSYPMAWVNGEINVNAPGPTAIYVEGSAGAVESDTSGWMATNHPSQPMTSPWTALSPGACAAYDLITCYQGNFTGTVFTIGSQCLAGGSQTTPGGDSDPGWCLVAGTAPPPPSCSTDPKDGQVYDSDKGTCTSGPERNAGACPICQKVGNPINVASGNKFEQVTDYQGVGPFPLVASRTYNSGVANEVNSPTSLITGQGAGWFSNHASVSGQILVYPVAIQLGQCQLSPSYECPLNNIVKYEATIWREDGSEEVFECQVDAAGNCPYSPEAGSAGQLIIVGGNYEYLRSDGYTEIYSMNTPSSRLVFLNSSGFLSTVQGPSGLKQTYAYTYGAVGNLQYLQSIMVTDPTGRTLQYNYDLTPADNAFGKIASVNTPDGNISYQYDTAGNLQSVTYPDGRTVTYEYADTALPHALTGLKDDNGNEYAAWSYDDTSGKAICSEHAPSGNLPSTATTCITDTGGVDKTAVTYNADGSADVTEATGLVRHMTFTSVNGRYLLATVDKRCIDCGDITHTVSYDSNGHVQTVTDFDGNVTTYTIDAAGFEQSRTEAYGKPEARTTVTTWYTPTGGVEQGLPKSITEKNASGTALRITTWCYNVSGSSCVDGTSVGPVWSKTVSDPVNTALAARTTTYTYSSTGLLTQENGPLTGLTDTTTYAYYTASSASNYNLNDLQTVTDALGHTTTVNQYSAGGRPLKVTDMNNVVTAFTYDARGRLTSRTLDSGGTDGLANAITTFTYCPAAVSTCPYGLLQSVQLPTTAAGHTYMSYSYDRAHRLTNVQDDLGETRTYAYSYGTQCVAGDVSCQTFDVEEQRFKSGGGAAVYVHHLTRDDYLDQLRDTDGDGDTTAYQHDADGNVTSVTDPLGHAATSYYDGLNRVYETQDAKLDAPTSYVLDALDHLTNVTSPRGLNTAYVYDAFGELLSQTSPDTGTSTADYTGWVSSAQVVTRDARNLAQTYTYDALDRLVSQLNGQRSFRYTYDTAANGVGRLSVASDISGTTTYTYDSHGNVSKKVMTYADTGNGYSIQYIHDLADQVTTIKYPPSNGTINYTLDALERPTEVDATYSGGPNERLAYSVTYLPFGPLTGLTYGNGLVEARSFDTAYRLTDIITKNGATPAVQDWHYGYNADGTIAAITDNLTSGNSQTFTYDPMQRLVTANGSYGAISVGSDPLNHPELSYDADGNRSQITVAGVTTTYAYASTSNRLLSYVSGGHTTTYAYDADGSTTSDGTYTYNYDINERNSKVLLGSTVEYQAENNFLGQRAVKIVGSNDYGFAYDEQGHIVAELNTNGTILRQHVWLGDREIAYYLTNINGSTTADVKYLHVDQINTPKFMTTSTKAIGWSWNPDPWGNSATYPTNFNDFFPGQYGDGQTLNFQNWMRDYDPQTGRYLQSDPVGLRGGINTYTYVRSNPLTHIDPLGLAVDLNLFDPKTDPGAWAAANAYVGDPNECTVSGHGNIDTVGGLNPTRLANRIRNTAACHGKPVRLLACNTGVTPLPGDFDTTNNGLPFGANLANLLHLVVWAPNTWGWYNVNGQPYGVYPTNSNLNYNAGEAAAGADGPNTSQPGSFVKFGGAGP